MISREAEEPEAHRRVKALRHGILCTLLGALIVWSGSEFMDGGPVESGSDANYYIAAAYNVFKHRVYSASTDADPRPSGFREPVFSAYLGVVISMSPRLRAMDLKTLQAGGPGLEALRRGLLPVLLLTAFLAMFLVYTTTKRISLGYVALVLVGFSHALLISIYSLKFESFIALPALLTSFLLYKAVEKKTTRYFAALGAALGLLVLTRAVFMYLIVMIWLSVAFLVLKKVLDRRQALAGLAVMTLAYVPIVGGWMLRNYLHSQSFYLAGRAGVVLSVRAQYDMMTPTEYAGAFLYWTPDLYIRSRVINSLFGKEALLPGGSLERLNRNNPQGFYKLGKDARSDLLRSQDVEEETAEIDRQLRRAATSVMSAHPFRHLLVTLPIAWQGLFPEIGWTVNAPIQVRVASPVIISLVYFGALFSLAFSAFRMAAWKLFAFTVPALYLYAVNSVFTHGLPRYSEPAIPILVVGLLVTVAHHAPGAADREHEGRAPGAVRANVVRGVRAGARQRRVG
jgi:hypothetical protein